MWNHVMFCQKYASDTRKIQCTRPRDSSTALNGRLFSWSEGLKAWNMVMCECLPTSFSTILDYLSYCPSYSFMSNANQLQSFTLCGALCSEYQCSINLIQFTVYQSMHSMLSENLTYHTLHHCATARLVSFERPALFTALKSLPCTELSSCEAKRPKDRRQVLMQLLRRKAAETVRDCTSTGMEQ